MITEFGQALRKIYKERGENQKTTAKKLGVTSAFLSTVELGKRHVPADMIDRLTPLLELNEEERTLLFLARDKVNKVKLNIKYPYSTVKIRIKATENAHKKNLILQIANNFEKIDDGTAIKIMNILNEMREKQND